MPVTEIPKDFISSWKEKPKAQVVPELATFHQESHRNIDVYSFILKNRKLYSPTARCFIRNIIVVNNSVGLLEMRAFDEIERWFAENENGVMVWISPQHPIFYPNDSKIVISEIYRQNNEKRLRNRAIILDYDQREALKFAQALAERSINKPFLESINSVRLTPLMLAADGWVDIMKEAIIDPVLWQKIETGHDLVEQEDVLKQSEIVYQHLFQKSMDNSIVKGFLGGGRGSCPVRMGKGGLSPFEAFSGASGASEVCSKIKCPDCGWEPDSDQEKLLERGELRSCPDCGYSP